VADAGEEQIFELAEHFGADRLALIAAGDEDHARLQDRDREVVRPEPNVALEERRRRLERVLHPRAHLVDEHVAPHLLELDHFFRGSARRLTIFGERTHYFACGFLAGEGPQDGVERTALGLEPTARIAAYRFEIAPPGAEAETMDREDRLNVHVIPMAWTWRASSALTRAPAPLRRPPSPKASARLARTPQGTT
jgi:hypothetical protein